MRRRLKSMTVNRSVPSVVVVAAGSESAASTSGTLLKIFVRNVFPLPHKLV